MSYLKFFQVNKVYDVRDINIKPVNVDFNNLGCTYEVVLKKESTFTKIEDIDISNDKFDISIVFTKFNDISKLKVKSNISKYHLIISCYTPYQLFNLNKYI